MNPVPHHQRASRILFLGQAIFCSTISLFCACNSLHRDDTSFADTQPAERSTLGIKEPGKYHFRDSQFVYYSDFPLKTDLPLFKELSDLREQLYKELHLPPSDRIVQVFLFVDQASYEKYLKSHYAELPPRRAYFIKQDRVANGTEELLVYTWWSEKVRQDLRHELTHGILHSVLKDVPRWLDEGLAEVYELPPENDGINANYLDYFQDGRVDLDLNHLEKLSDVQQMLLPEYRQAWAWTHFILHSSRESKEVLLAYLQQLRLTNKPGPLLPRLKAVVDDPATALRKYLAKLEAVPTARTDLFSGEKP